MMSDAASSDYNMHVPERCLESGTASGLVPLMSDTPKGSFWPERSRGGDCVPKVLPAPDIVDDGESG